MTSEIGCKTMLRRRCIIKWGSHCSTGHMKYDHVMVKSNAIDEFSPWLKSWKQLRFAMEETYHSISVRLDIMLQRGWVTLGRADSDFMSSRTDLDLCARR